MPITIGDLWLLKLDDRPTDIRSALFGSRQIEGKVRRANEERRGGRANWMAIDLEEVILTLIQRTAETASAEASQARKDAAPVGRVVVACCLRGCNYPEARPCRRGRELAGRAQTLF